MNSPHQIFDFYEQLRDNLQFNKFEINNLLFIEYNCPLDSETVKIWSKYDYIIYVLSGVKTWITQNKRWRVHKGEALYVRKGANIIEQSFDEDFCMLGFFITDEVIQKTMKGLKGLVRENIYKPQITDKIFLLEDIPNLDLFYQSMLSYFRHSKAPMSTILELKARELLLNIISSNNHPQLISYFNLLANDHDFLLEHIMEENFTYNLKIEEFASLTHRSISSFKRDFKKIFNTTPGKWLLKKRLEFAAYLLKTSNYTITRIAFDSGFEDLSHFSKTFREKYQYSPNEYRKN